MGKRVQALTSVREVKPSEPTTVSLRNIKVRQRAILQEMSFFAATDPSLTPLQLYSLSSKLDQTVNVIEKICADTNTTPANLTNPSRQIYAWMKFLTHPGKVEIHHHTTYRIQQIANSLLHSRSDFRKNSGSSHIFSSFYSDIDDISHRPHWQKIVAEVTNISGLYRVKHTRDTAILTVSEGFIYASDDILMALVYNSLVQREKKTTKIICDFAYSEEYCQVLRELDHITEVNAENPQGEHYDLDYLFTKINREYFAATLKKPRLIWSSVPTYRKLGHYEPARDRIVMSLALDHHTVPQYVVEFVLYHELLHKLHGTKLVNGRRMIHTPEFRRDELKFKQYREAEIWLQQVAVVNMDSQQSTVNA